MLAKGIFHTRLLQRPCKSYEKFIILKIFLIALDMKIKRLKKYRKHFLHIQKKTPYMTFSQFSLSNWCFINLKFGDLQTSFTFSYIFPLLIVKIYFRNFHESLKWFLSRSLKLLVGGFRQNNFISFVITHKQFISENYSK